MPQQSPTRFNSSAPAPAGSWAPTCLSVVAARDRKSTRLNSSHSQISYAVFCLKKKKLLDLDEHQTGLPRPRCSAGCVRERVVPGLHGDLGIGCAAHLPYGLHDIGISDAASRPT